MFGVGPQPRVSVAIASIRTHINMLVINENLTSVKRARRLGDGLLGGGDGGKGGMDTVELKHLPLVNKAI